MATPAYSSVGTGFGTATQNTDLAPTCPAVVNAGDILIALISIRNLTTVPTTPSGWTLLDGPRANGTGRAWLYGKVADGTEDGATVNFGNHAVAVARSGQIFRFTGNNYTGQSIASIVLGFTSTNGTGTTIDDAGVTTTLNNCLALQFLKIDDNNTVGNFTGETGGDWTEATAEYSHNLSTGFTAQLQTAAMTTAGTINGGTLVQSAADPWVIIGCYIREPIVDRSGTALIHGGGAPTATGGHVYIEGLVITGGGTVTATGTHVIDNRNGTALIHGGGTLVATETKDGGGNALVHGGGTLVATYSRTITGANVVITGGGTLTVRYSTTGTVVGVKISGGGEITANIIPISGTVLIHGGGSLAASGQGQRTAVISGGGSLVVTHSTTGILVGAVIHGGGSVRVNAIEGSAVISGGGSITIVKAKGASTPRVSSRRAAGGLVYLFGDAGAAALVHGGGTIIATGQQSLGAAVIHGGGTLTATGSKSSSKTVTITGGGSVVVTRTKGGVSTVVVTGGGQVVVTYSRSTPTNTVGKNLVASYDLKALARKDLLVLYDLVAFGTAGANLLVQYDLSSLTRKSLIASYDVFATTNKDLVARYDMRVPISVDLVTLYDYLQLVGVGMIAQYDVVGRVRKDFIAVYDVKPLVEDITKGYAILVSRR